MVGRVPAAPSPRGERAKRERSVLLAAIADRDLLLRRVLVGRLDDHLAHHLAVAFHERRHLLEAAARPLLELHLAGSLMVGAGRLDRREQAAGTELLDARLREVQVLEAPAKLLGRHDLALAVLV